MSVKVGQEYIDKHGTIYRIRIISSDSVASYDICSNVEKDVYYHAGSSHINTLEILIEIGELIPLTKASKALYGKN